MKRFILFFSLLLPAIGFAQQTNIYLFTGSETNITLPAGTYTITAYGATGGHIIEGGGNGGQGAEISGEFNFPAATTLTLLVGGAGGDYYFSSGGGGGSFVVNGNAPLLIAGGGGGGNNNGGFGGLGLITTGGGDGFNSGGAGGTNGDGGEGSWGGGGGGFYSNGTIGAGAIGSWAGGGGGNSFFNGGDGGGGFGGGGGGGFGGGGGQGYMGNGPSGGGGGGGYSGGGGGADSAAGGGGGSIIASSAITNLAEISGIASPDDSTGNGEIIITAVSTVTSPASPEYSIDWFKIASGGGTSTNSIYSITGTIGQPDAGGAMTNGIYSATGGFWSLISVVQMAGAPALSLTHTANSVKISWPASASGFVLQQNSNLSTTNWTTSGYTISNDGTYNSITITSPAGNLFFRLTAGGGK